MPTVPVRVLIAEDFEPWRRSVCSLLATHNQLQLVGEAADGPEAAQRARELHPDLILMDVNLPNLNGIETAKLISQTVPGIKIVFLTVNNEIDVIRVALSTAGQGYVLKTDAGTELWSAIETVLRGDQYVSSGLARCFEPEGQHWCVSA
jgi:DNA-binding NarL/FixJ family response regulator